MKIYGMHSLLASLCLLLCACGGAERYDVVVVGGGTSGTAAGLQAARIGAKTLIVEQYDWLGGMLTSAGVSATDGNYRLRGGMWAEFRDSLEAHYGGPEALKTGWVSNVLFEPSVGARIFANMAAAEPNLTVLFRSKPENIRREGGVWKLSIGGKPVEAKVLIDATELGDIARALGVTYDKGMDAAAQTGEEIAPAQANDIVQDLTLAAVLKDYGRDVTIPRPEGYDPALFACCCINDLCVNPKEPERMWSREMMITYGKLPNGKYMINWPIEGNDYYVDMVDMSPREREEALARAKNFTMQFLYFLQTELGFSNLGLADDEFPTPDRLPLIPYHRESRRTHGLVRFTLTDITDPYARTLYRTTIGVGDYPVDQHHARYSGWGELPNLYFHPIPSYGVPLGVMIPAGHEGLIVAEKSISVTNLVNGSTRLQPVVLQIGQAAGVLAALATGADCDVAEVSVRDVQRAVLDAGGYLLPYLDLPVSDERFKAMQRIGATGILRGRGTNVGWENQTWFDADSTITTAELCRGLREVYPQVAACEEVEAVHGGRLAAMLAEALGKPVAQLAAQLEEHGGAAYDASRPLTRLECAVLIDAVADPFGTVAIDIQGNYNRK